MLNRRYLRIKVMQGLYTYFQAHSDDVLKGERELLRSIDKVYDLYLILLQFLIELRSVASAAADDARNKRLPSSEDLNPNRRFIENPLLLQLEQSTSLASALRERKLNWSGQMEILRRTFVSIRTSEMYQEYMSAPIDSFELHREFIIHVFKQYVADSDAMDTYLEERSLYWPNDLNMAVAPMILKTLEIMEPAGEKNFILLELYKDPEEDRQFVLDLYRKTIINDKSSEQMIGEKTRNWEVERIAMMDVLLMKMAITELLQFHSIPVKVSLNEYIEISKLYSTPKSKVFINGVLDKLVIDLRSKDLLIKTGRGLIE
jgi:N utilization substance protein B